MWERTSYELHQMGPLKIQAHYARLCRQFSQKVSVLHNFPANSTIENWSQHYQFTSCTWNWVRNMAFCLWVNSCQYDQTARGFNETMNIEEYSWFVPTTMHNYLNAEHALQVLHMLVLESVSHVSLFFLSSCEYLSSSSVVLSCSPSLSMYFLVSSFTLVDSAHVCVFPFVFSSFHTVASIVRTSLKYRINAWHVDFFSSARCRRRILRLSVLPINYNITIFALDLHMLFMLLFSSLCLT